MSWGGKLRDLLWVTVLIEYCMVHGQIQGCNLTKRFMAGSWMTVKLPSMTCVINLVRCRINVVFRMIIYHLKFRRDCVREVNSCARGIGEGHLEGRRKNTRVHCFTSAFPSNANENCTLNAGLICDEISSKEYICGMITWLVALPLEGLKGSNWHITHYKFISSFCFPIGGPSPANHQEITNFQELVTQVAPCLGFKKKPTSPFL